MAYAVLEAEIVGKWGELQRTLDAADKAMRAMATRNYSVRLRLDRGIFDQIREVRRMLTNVGGGNIALNITVNGEAVVTRSMQRTKQGVDGVTASLDRSNRSMAVGVAEARDYAAAMALANNPAAWATAPRSAAALRDLNKLRQVQETLNKANARGGTNLDALHAEAVRMDAARTAAIWRELGAEADRLTQRREKAAAQAAAAESRAFREIGAESDRLTRQRESDARRIARVNEQAAAEAARAFDASARQVIASETAKTDQMLALLRRQEAEYMRSRGVIASVIGGERNINAHLIAGLQRTGVSGAHIDRSGAAVGPNRVATEALIEQTAATQRLNAEVERCHAAALRMNAAFDSRKARADTAALDAEVRKLARSTQILRIAGMGNRAGELEGLTGDQAIRRAKMLAQGIRSVGSEANGAIPFLRKAWLTINAFGTSYLILHGIFMLFRGIKDVLIDFPASMETVEVGLTRMLDRSKEKAQSFMAVLKEFAILTPFVTKDLAPLAQQALAFNLVDRHASSEVINREMVSLLRDAGDAAFGLGKGVQGVASLIQGFGKMTVATRVMAREMLTFQRLGINAWGYLAEATGKTTAEVRKMVTRGMIPAKEAIEAIRAGLRRDFGGGMEAATRTLTGAAARITDALQILISDAVSGLFNRYRDEIVKLSEYISSADFARKLTSVVAEITRAVETAIFVVTSIYDTIRHMNPDAVKALTLLALVIRSGPIREFYALYTIVNTITHWDTATRGAKMLTAALIALAGAYALVKINAAGAAFAGGMEAFAVGSAQGLKGFGLLGAQTALMLARLAPLIAIVNREFAVLTVALSGGGWLAALRALPSALLAVAGGFTALATAAASVIAILGLVVVAAELAGIAWFKYQENAAIARDANIDLAASVKITQGSLQELKKWAELDTKASESVARLRVQYDALHGTLEGLTRFRNVALPRFDREIRLNTTLTKVDRRLIQDARYEFQRQADEEAIKLRVALDADSEKSLLSLSNFLEAVNQQYGLLDLFTQIQNLISLVNASLRETIASLLALIETGFRLLWDKVAGGLRSVVGDAAVSVIETLFSKIGEGFQQARDLAFNLFSGFKDFFNNVFSPYSGNVGETEENAPGRAGYGPEYDLQQANRLRRLQEMNQRAGHGGLDSVTTQAERVARQRAADEADHARRARTASGIPHITPTAPTRSGPTPEQRRALRAENDRLQDAATYYAQLAKAAEDSAKRQIDALTKVRDVLRDIFGTIQDELAKYGVYTSPLDAVISRIERIANLGPRIAQIAQEGLTTSQGFARHAQQARMAQERMNGRDGVVPSVGVAGGPVTVSGGSMPGWMRGMWNKVGDTIGLQCGTTITAFLHRAGIGGSATSIARSGNARANADGTYAPGTIFNFRGGKGGYRVNHYAVVGPDGQHWLESNWAGRGQRPNMITANRRINWARDIDAATWGGRRNIGQAGAGSPGRVSGRVPGFLRNAGGMGAAASLESGNGGNFVNEIMGLLQDLRTVKLGPPPREWGPVLHETADNATRMRVQMMLANTATQTMLRAGLGEAGFAAMAREFRTLANEADAMLNKLKANAQVLTDIRQLESARRLRGQENNPVAAFNERTRPGGDLAAADNDQLERLWGATLRDVLETATDAYDKLKRAEADRRGGLAATRPFVQAATVDTYGLARAQELYNQKLQFARSPEMVRLWNTNRTQFNAMLRDFEQFSAANYDLSKGDERRQAMASARMELDRSRTALQAQVPLVNDLALSETGLNDALERQSYYFQQLYQLRDKGHTDQRSRELAAELTARNANNTALQREVALRREARQASYEAGHNALLARERQGIYGSTRYGSTEQENALKLAEQMSALQARIDKGEFDTTTFDDTGLAITRRHNDDIAAARAALESNLQTETETARVATRAGSIYSAQNDLLDAQNSLRQHGLDVAGVLTDSTRAQLDLQIEIQKRLGTSNQMSTTELNIRQQIIDVQRQQAALDQAARMNDLHDQTAAAGIRGTENDRTDFVRVQQLLRMYRELDRLAELQTRAPDPAEWRKLQDQINGVGTAIENAERQFEGEKLLRRAQETAAAMQQAFDAATNAVTEGFNAMATSGGSAFDRIVAGISAMVKSIADYLLDLAKRILANYIIMQLFNAIMPGFGNFMGSVQGAANKMPSMGSGGFGKYTDPGMSAGMSNSQAAAMSGTATMQSSAQVVNNFSFPNVTDAESARGASEVIGSTVKRTVTDSRKSVAQDSADFVSYGSKRR